MTLKEKIDNLTDDVIINHKYNNLKDLSNHLIEQSLVKDENDINKIIIDGIRDCLDQDDELPIKYYFGDYEEVQDKEVNEPTLTDDFIRSNLI